MKDIKHKQKEGYEHDAYHSALFNATYMWCAIKGEDFDKKQEDSFFFDAAAVRCAIIEMETAIDASHYDDSTYYTETLAELRKLLNHFK